MYKVSMPFCFWFITLVFTTWVSYMTGLWVKHNLLRDSDELLQGNSKGVASRNDILNPVGFNHEQFGQSAKILDSYDRANKKKFTSHSELFLYSTLRQFSLEDEVYHEALVHPSMLIADDSPKRVAILGGGQGAALREVLKHTSVEHVTIIKEIKENKMNFPSMCGTKLTCFKDTRVNFVFADATKWLADQKTKSQTRYDVVIADSIEFVNVLYSKEVMLELISGLLSSKGIFIMNFGIAFPRKQKRALSFFDIIRRTIINRIENSSFHYVHVYDEIRCYSKQCSFLMACKNSSCDDKLSMNTAEAELILFERLQQPTSAHNMPLKYLDGTIFQNYKVPSKSWQYFGSVVKTYSSDKEFFDGFQKVATHFTSDKFEVKNSTLGNQVGRGVFALVPISKGALLMQENAGNDVIVKTTTYEKMHDLVETLPQASYLNAILNYVEGYGFETDDGHAVEAGILAFVNHVSLRQDMLIQGIHSSALNPLISKGMQWHL